ncbi:LysE family translocator [Oricola sp.]|uniref:LysE family translocator n=1 Tax=Oricola sp. TaxID=1979950 RepID=UPI003BA85AC7
MTLAGFVTYAVALSIAAAIPGPGVIALVARALGSGFRPTLPMLFGLALGDVVYLGAAVLGLAYVAATFGAAFTAIKYLGAAYLVWMAISFWRAGASTEKVAARSAGTAWSGFVAGFLVTMGNPKVIIFYLALLPAFLDLSSVGVADFAVLIVLTFAVLVGVLLPYVALAGRARTMLQTPRALVMLNRVAATFLAGAAAAIASRTG